MTLVPKCAGYEFDPPSVTWDGVSSTIRHFRAKGSKWATRAVLESAGILNTPVYIRPSKDLARCWEVESDSMSEGTPLQLYKRTDVKCKWTIKFADTFNGRDRFEIHNSALDRYATIWYPWDKKPDERPPVEGQRVGSRSLQQMPRHHQRFNIMIGPDNNWVFAMQVFGGVDSPIVGEDGNTGDTTKLVLGAMKDTAPAAGLWTIGR